MTHQVKFDCPVPGIVHQGYCCRVLRLDGFAKVVLRGSSGHFLEGEQWTDILSCFLLPGKNSAEEVINTPSCWWRWSAVQCLEATNSSKAGKITYFTPSLMPAPWSKWKMSWDHGKEKSQEVRKGTDAVPRTEGLTELVSSHAILWRQPETSELRVDFQICLEKVIVRKQYTSVLIKKGPTFLGFWRYERKALKQLFIAFWHFQQLLSSLLLLLLPPVTHRETFSIKHFFEFFKNSTAIKIWAALYTHESLLLCRKQHYTSQVSMTPGVTSLEACL